MIEVKTTKKLFKKEQFNVTNYDVSDLYNSVIDIDEYSKKYKDMSISFDGGGILGVHGALHCYIMEQKSKKSIKNVFKTMWGTSTGAILAGLYSIGVPGKDVFDLYVEKGPDIFNKTKGGMINIFSKTSYDSTFIDALLDNYFGLMTFTDINNKGISLNIAIVDPIDRETKICNFDNCPKMLIKNAIRSSMSAPLYFGPYSYYGYGPDNIMRNNIAFDGGTGNYNSTLEKAISKKLYKEKLNVNDFYVHSIGCGKVIHKYKMTREENIDVIKKFRKIKQALWTISFGREESVVRQVKWANYRKEDTGINFNRVDFNLPEKLDGLDKTNNINELLDIIQNQMIGGK